ncbi:DegT/DnrJ/EryC1/StrS family aminotransferase [Polycladomyces subterraneus]|uniref:DegT/DnrJ/EryC1/StrS family aminotransferase n=1 Tax=Polycladomyces subterraneus TaxID=1016997 RepID=A0ABT8IKW8_9BACL|nr:DegT/DnrJ/EryC1/StrS family aminotransferase [Polycladomyces subterraneus]MDN4593404.1 DegT/DnrJ/EryC1/StrS family aminotransferase [Polycladomyces subterraneus]
MEVWEGRLAKDGGTPVIEPGSLPTVSDASGRTFGEEELAELTEVIRSGRLGRNEGTKVKAFEQAFARRWGVPHATASTSGTAALHLAIGAINPDPGDEIITTPITDFGTIIPILMQNAIPVFADIDPETWCLDPTSVEQRITDRTRAIILVHLFGRPADPDPILGIARRYGLRVIEDCSQAFLTESKGRLVGTIGDIGCFSFQQSKHMSCGDGGMTITKDEELAWRIRLFQDKGWPREGNLRTHLFLSPNYRMTELQGAVGLAQLKKLDDVVRRREERARQLTLALSDVPELRPIRLGPGDRASYWLYPMHVDTASLGVSTKELAYALQQEGLPARAGYVEPMYKVPAIRERQTYGRSGYPFVGAREKEVVYPDGLCPHAEAMAERMILLAWNERYTEEHVRAIASGLKKVVYHYRQQRHQGGAAG